MIGGLDQQIKKIKDFFFFNMIGGIDHQIKKIKDFFILT
jgi:ATP-dependent 26S proteasome regulatory subunit